MLSPYTKYEYHQLCCVAIKVSILFYAYESRMNLPQSVVSSLEPQLALMSQLWLIRQQSDILNTVSTSFPFSLTFDILFDYLKGTARRHSCILCIDSSDKSISSCQDNTTPFNVDRGPCGCIAWSCAATWCCMRCRGRAVRWWGSSSWLPCRRRHSKLKEGLL